LTRLVDATAGVPFLLAAADCTLTGADGQRSGVQVSSSDVDLALDALTERLEGAASSIQRKELGWELTPRALELLRMIGAVSRDASASTVVVETLLADWWPEFAADDASLASLRAFEPDVRSDQVALDELQELGLLPSTDAQRGGHAFLPIEPGDPVRRLAERLA